MSRTRIVKGNIVKASEGTTILEAQKSNIIAHAAATNNWHGEENGITEHNYTPEKDEVEAAKLDGDFSQQTTK